jgi:GNAT superfamily N-acetyltransferase
MDELTIADERLQRAHVNAIDACNQRGGRMLSLVDLLDAGTVDLPVAAYLGAAMRGGASLLVGARPGGAGKTAVMCALLNFLPDRTTIRAAESQAVLREGLRDTHFGDVCYLAHEISPARYYAYIWDGEVRIFFRLGAQGHVIASNLHADTLEEARDQICGENGVDPAHLAAVTLKVFLRVGRAGLSTLRRVSHVYESDGVQDRLLWTSDGRGALARCESDSAIVSPEQERRCAGFLRDLQSRDVRRIGDVRRALAQHA